jgi:hypothetical protein
MKKKPDDEQKAESSSSPTRVAKDFLLQSKSSRHACMHAAAIAVNKRKRAGTSAIVVLVSAR